ncbi:phosphoserine transaminase [Parvularcula dongshanensis]|uniref:phosphoserine transaminase n=1 Tax=Parvularcula dongshanensis TaxID=1173995 RepID=A0A840I412_9PROT|nr:phosphoserine transaminase [Parvularcula dongshanensis]MBB4659003.1 phosphoserine aminotransferase [Parvularcula dongshanensis]
MEQPSRKPANPSFSSGPCAKRPGWKAESLPTDALGRSHRSALGKARLAEAIAKTRAVLQVPDSHLIGIVPASDTGAYEMAMWTLLGARPVTAVAWESFGQGWVTDAVKQLKVDAKTVTADYGVLPDLGGIDTDTDVLFTWNGTTSGVRVPNGDWIDDDRQGLTLCDATSAAFAQDLPWAKLDVVTYSWQKVLGGEGQHGMLILGPRAVERLESHTPSWPIPKIFRLTKGGKLIEGIFKGETINTPSMLCVEDYIDALDWAASIGGLDALKGRADENAGALSAWVEKTDWIDHLAGDPAARSNTSVCLKITDARVANLSEDDQRAFVKRMEKRLSAEDAAFDIGAYRDAPPGLRIWCGATVETDDVRILTEWLDYAFAAEAASL